MELKIFFKGFNYNQDGPGNRLVYHLSGCNMCCPWCSNPEGMCFNYEKAKTYTIEKVLDEIISCKAMFYNGGGVTFTGGEIGIQAKALGYLLKKLNDIGIHTAIETNASLDGFKDLLLADYVMLDFKHYDSDKLKKIVGVGNEKIKENIAIAIENKKYLHIRIPLINGFNADEKDIKGFLDYFNLLNKELFDVEFLPYHEYGKDKWKLIGKEYKVQDGKISNETLKKFISKFKDSKIKIIKT